MEELTDELTDEQAIDKAVDMLKEKGIFDQIRKNCLEDINTKVSSKKCRNWFTDFEVKRWKLRHALVFLFESEPKNRGLCGQFSARQAMEHQPKQEPT